MNNKINLSNASYKEWIGLLAAPIFWVASLICFVLGLAFRAGSIYLPGIGIDFSLFFSLGLGFGNTAIQIVGNDTDKDDLGIALLLMWGASYMLGIGSNVNYLNSVVTLSSPLLQFLVTWGLGIMIEVAPERLLVKWLRAVGIISSNKKLEVQSNKFQNSRNSEEQNRAVENYQRYKTSHPKKFERELTKQPRRESPYHPISYSPIPEEELPGAEDIPEFLRQQREIWLKQNAKRI